MTSRPSSLPSGQRGRPHGSDKWKQDEREFAAWAGGARVPSQGVACEDIRSTDASPVKWTAEHKSPSATAERKKVPQWMQDQIRQARENAERVPDALPLMMTTINHGQGVPKTRVLSIVVDTSTMVFAEAALALLNAAKEVVSAEV